MSSTEGIVLSGLEKTFKSPQGPVRAVRGIDVSISPGETVAFLGPNGAGKSTTIDMLLGLLPPDKGTVTLFGKPPVEAIASGAIGAMLQTGALIRDLSVRELVDDDGVALSRRRSASTRCSSSRASRTSPTGARRSSPAARRSACASRSRSSAIPTCSCSTSRPSRWTSRGGTRFWTTMRGFAARGKTVLFATHYLEEADAYADRAILMAHGRVVADGPTNEIKAMVGLRTIRATLPDADLDAARAAARRDGRRAPRRGRRPHAAPTPTPRSAPCSPPIPTRATSRSRPAASSRRSCSSRAATTSEMTSYAHVHPLRAAAHVPQPALLHLLARLPARPLLPDRRRRTTT